MLSAYPAADFPSQATAIVTGAGSQRGIGRATAHRLAREGWAVAVVDLDQAATDRDARTRVAWLNWPQCGPLRGRSRARGQERCRPSRKPPARATTTAAANTHPEAARA